MMSPGDLQPTKKGHRTMFETSDGHRVYETLWGMLQYETGQIDLRVGNAKRKKVLDESQSGYKAYVDGYESVKP